MKKLILVLIILGLTFCQQQKEKHPTKKDYFIALIILNTKNPNNSCVSNYGQLNPLLSSYQTNEFINYSSTCDTVIIGDSTMDLSRQTSFYDKLKTSNYAISGNTACDYINQMEYLKCNPKNVIIASADGNGILRGVSTQTSIDTINQVVNRAKEKWNPNIIVVIGVHPILLVSANKSKNEVNKGVSQIKGICYINPLPIFGVGENDPPDTSYMIDQIHYKEPIYSKYKIQIENQCGLKF